MPRTISKEMVNDAKLIFRIQHFIHCPNFPEYNISSILLSLPTLCTNSFSLWDSSDITLTLVSYFQQFTCFHNCCLESCAKKDFKITAQISGKVYGQMVISDMNVGLGTPGFSSLFWDQLSHWWIWCLFKILTTNSSEKRNFY